MQSPDNICQDRLKAPLSVLFSLQMVFGIGKVQMKFLHLLSSEASQSIGLHCRRDHSNSTADGFNSPGLKPTESSNLQFRGWNNQMFETDTLLEPYVLKDECKVGFMRDSEIRYV